MFGNMPILKDLSIRLDRGIKMLSFTVCIIFVGILLGAVLLLLLRRDLILSISSFGVVGDLLEFSL